MAVIAVAAAVALGAVAIVAAASTGSNGANCVSGPGVDQHRALAHGSVIESDDGNFYWKLGDRGVPPVIPIDGTVPILLSDYSKTPIVKNQDAVTRGTNALTRGVLLREDGSSQVWRIDDVRNKQAVSNACADDVYIVPDVPGVLDQLPLRKDR